MADRPFATGAAGAAWWAFRGVLAVVGSIALVGFGAQVVLAPILLPLEWVAARLSGPVGRRVFTGLFALLAGEVAWILSALWLEPISTPTIAAGLGVLLAASVVVWRTTGPVPDGRDRPSAPDDEDAERAEHHGVEHEGEHEPGGEEP